MEHNLQPLSIVESRSILEKAIETIASSDQAMDEVAQKAVDILVIRMETNPEAIATKNLLEFLTRHQANKVSSQAVIKDLAIEVIKLNNSARSLDASDIKPPADSAISALISQNAKSGYYKDGSES